jgi:proteasome lid subunit RPN8/RPN11
MTFSIRTTIRELVAPKHRLSCSFTLWRIGLLELGRRGGMRRESGAFLLGMRDGDRRRITDFVFYDDLDPQCLDTGIVVFDGTGYGPLWQLCRERGRVVVADVHTHGGQARQSPDDRDHPMIARRGHVALIVPGFAQQTVGMSELGIYEYLGDHRWKDYSGRTASAFFYIGRWG